MTIRTAFVTAIILTCPAGLAAAADAGATAPVAPFCAGCHTPEPGTMPGFLDTVSTMAGAIQMDFGSHKEVLSYGSDTVLKNVPAFDALAGYRREGFKVTFEDRRDRKHATAIVRFDLAKTIREDEKLSKDAFKQALQDASVAVFDVRPEPMYAAGHVPGAASLPATAVADFPRRLPADRAAPVVLYGPGGCLAPTTSLRVKQLGYSSVKIYPLGFADWSATEYSVTTAPWLRRAIDDSLGVIIIDVRPAEAVATGHIRGAVNIPLGEIGASRHRLPPAENAPIVLYGAGAGQAARQLVDWGYKTVRVRPMTYAEWAGADNPVERGPTGSDIVYDPKPKPGAIRLAEFSRLAKAPRSDVLLVDLRNDYEIWELPVPHAVNIPFDLLTERLEALAGDRTPVFFCPTGARAEMAYNLLANRGRQSRFLEVGVIVDADGNVRVTGR
jgi:rhodanese-related sulfurtransferase